jgi:hypothetical protein
MLKTSPSLMTTDGPIVLFNTWKLWGEIIYPREVFDWLAGRGRGGPRKKDLLSSSAERRRQQRFSRLALLKICWPYFTEP